MFLPNSSLDLKEAEFNDSAQNHIIIEGIFEENGYYNGGQIIFSKIVLTLKF
ncbi:unknown [Rickettsia conorii str. Malish 7]|uniref:Uncharacterized protein n=1 Tax=Rickettsia conorii (strain ATCC VR-613 / Malish 7) TaxID=272944 RepID=Q92HK2_RICCN|nr:unknown [Rickettsia conorii str. Malish 7]